MLKLLAKLLQLDALLAVTHGDLRQGFENMKGDQRDHYMSVCTDLDGECMDLGVAIVEAVSPPVVGVAVAA